MFVVRQTYCGKATKRNAPPRMSFVAATSPHTESLQTTFEPSFQGFGISVAGAGGEKDDGNFRLDLDWIQARRLHATF